MARNLLAFSEALDVLEAWISKGLGSPGGE
jgi:hypothetical protein